MFSVIIIIKPTRPRKINLLCFNGNIFTIFVEPFLADIALIRPSTIASILNNLGPPAATAN
jgi:hypothetical protein